MFTKEEAIKIIVITQKVESLRHLRVIDKFSLVIRSYYSLEGDQSKTLSALAANNYSYKTYLEELFESDALPIIVNFLEKFPSIKSIIEKIPE